MKTLVFVFFGLFVTAQNHAVDHNPGSRGEELNFKLSYGWFTIGKATMKTAPNYKRRDGHDCYQVDITGKTSGLIGVFSKVNDKWGAIIRKKDFVPYYSYRDLEEGNYFKNEKVYFEHSKHRIRVEDYDVKAGKPRPIKYFELKDENLYDMIGGLMYARSLDYSNVRKGDTLKMKAYFDSEFYDFAMVYHGVELTKTKVGRLNCFKLVPIIPDNKIFQGRNAVTFWISADVNRLLLKAKASMFFGTAYVELTSYKNVKRGIDFN